MAGEQVGAPHVGVERAEQFRGVRDGFHLVGKRDELAAFLKKCAVDAGGFQRIVFAEMNADDEATFFFQRGEGVGQSNRDAGTVPAAPKHVVVWRFDQIGERCVIQFNAPKRHRQTFQRGIFPRLRQTIPPILIVGGDVTSLIEWKDVGTDAGNRRREYPRPLGANRRFHFQQQRRPVQRRGHVRLTSRNAPPSPPIIVTQIDHFDGFLRHRQKKRVVSFSLWRKARAAAQDNFVRIGCDRYRPHIVCQRHRLRRRNGYRDQ